jgi:maltooligosyltrehalose trehalohydrolase
VVLDVVYNHLGPEGNYLAQFAPYFTTRYQTPWGPALNFDGPGSDEVRRYFIGNALYWLRDLHLDGLRLDAIHGIVDTSAFPFLAELQAAVEQESERLGRRLWLFAESDLNDVRVLRSREQGGFGMAAQWSDDFHHALHVELTGERSGYYRDFTGLEDLATALRDGFVYSGQYSPHRQRRHGNSSRGFAADRFVVFAQNHDQIGNRAQGDRLSAHLSLEALKLAAGVTLLSPFLPLLFMGEEYGETAPFPYFTSHGDAGLAEAVRRGRAQEFAAFRWMGEVPDPQAEATFAQARLDANLRKQPRHHALERLYRRLLQLRRELPALAQRSQAALVADAHAEQRLLVLRREQGDSQVLALFHFGDEPRAMQVAVPEGEWTLLLDSAHEEWMGPVGTVPEKLAGGTVTVPMPAHSFAVYRRG